MKAKDRVRANGTPEWVSAWKRLLSNQVVVRCLLEEALDYSQFRMELYLLSEGRIYRATFDRYWGSTIKRPATFIENYKGPLEAFLDDLGAWWGNFLRVNPPERLTFMVAEPYRGVIRPLGTENLLIVPPNHPLFMAGYGAVAERISLIRVAGIDADRCPVEIWLDIERRFRAFLYQQQVSLFRNTVGEVAPPE
ncbi:MAG: hypothetical protein Q7R58_00135 [bacterium]|nr:hypothetical protein [bacterium]